jgi:hypothetical protein
MARSANAQLALDLYEKLPGCHGWTASDAWQGIARLLLSCEIWNDGWQHFHDVIVYRESNDFRIGARGPNAVLKRAEALAAYLASQLSVPRSDLCKEIGIYWKDPAVATLQPHNLVGNAFRSLTVHILERFGDSGITYDEEINAHALFPGYPLATRSANPKIDIVARRGSLIVALISSRWRFRHDRVDVVEEAMAYAQAARHANPACRLYASIAEFTPNRIHKILVNCPPHHPNAALTAAVHFQPQLISTGLGENGRMTHLKSLEWLIRETFSW